MKKATVITNLILIALIGISLNTYAKSAKSKNILFIAVDDLRPELGCYGNAHIVSPNLDRLASQGRVFKNHFVQIPTCGASRYCLLTGTRPHDVGTLSNHAIKNKISDLPEGETPESFIHHFRRNGYYTVGIGKISHSADGLLYEYTGEPSAKRELPHSWDELHFDAGKWETGWNAFFGYADGENRQSKNRQVKPYECGDVDDEGYPDGLTAKLASEKLKELAEKDKPFLLAVGFFKPHLPFNAPKKYWDLYNREEIPLSPNRYKPKNVNKSSLHKSDELRGYKLGEEKARLGKPVSKKYERKLRHAYFASVSYIDAQIGKLLNTLEETGEADNTIVVVWGDHGWHLGDHTLWGKHTIFDRSLRSSLLVKAPDMKNRGTATDGVVETIDLYPTLSELCGLSVPEKVEGKSFAKLLKRPGKKGKKAAYGYFYDGITMFNGEYRLTRYFREGKPVIELYDHKNDLWETKNIAKRNPDIVKQLMPLWEKGNTGLFESDTITF
jgi:arylsulfatase A-like enzyme